MAPAGADWEQPLAYWRTLATDPDAAFDREVVLDVVDLAPRVSWGTTPEESLPVDGVVPDPDQEANHRAGAPACGEA